MTRKCRLSRILGGLYSVAVLRLVSTFSPRFRRQGGVMEGLWALWDPTSAKYYEGMLRRTKGRWLRLLQAITGRMIPSGVPIHRFPVEPRGSFKVGPLLPGLLLSIILR